MRKRLIRGGVRALASAVLAAAWSTQTLADEGSRCDHYLRSTQLVADTVVFSDLELFRSVDSLLWLVAGDRRARVGHDPSRVDVSFLGQVTREGASRSQELARVLAFYLAGLRGSEMARAAAFHYSQLGLPPGPALAVAVNRRNGTLGRSLALRSIASSRSSPWFEDLLIFLACDLNERMIGRSEPGKRLSSILDTDELTLARETAVFFAASNATFDQLGALIGTESPLFRFFREARGSQNN